MHTYYIYFIYAHIYILYIYALQQVLSLTFQASYMRRNISPGSPTVPGGEQSLKLVDENDRRSQLSRGPKRAGDGLAHAINR